MPLRTNQKCFLILLSLTSFNVFAYCGVPPIPSTVQASSILDNKFYAGFKWTLNEGIKPEAVVGFRSARINPSSYTNGGDISISAKFIDKFELGKLRAKYFSGINTAQAELSGGYDFTKGLFTGVSVNAPYINLGIDYLIKAKESRFEPYAMLNSLGKYHKPTSTETATCPDGYPFYNSYWEQYAVRYPNQSYTGPCFSYTQIGPPPSI